MRVIPGLTHGRGDRKGVKNLIYKNGALRGTSLCPQGHFVYTPPTGQNRGKPGGLVMGAQVVHLKTKRHDAIMQACQLILDFGGHFGLQDATRDELAKVVVNIQPPGKWAYVMIHPNQLIVLQKAIRACPKPAETLAVWTSCVSYMSYDQNGEIMAGRDVLSEASGVSPEHVSRALTQLVELGGLLKLKRGRYAVNPNLGWAGSLIKREAVAKTVEPVQLKLV